MKRPGFLEGLMLACILSLATRYLFDLFVWLFDPRLAVLLLISSLCLVYNLYLLTRSRVTSGRITILVSWIVISLLTWSIQVPVTVYILVQVGMTWMIRSFNFHTSVLSVLMDLGLVTAGGLLGAWAMTQTHGLASGVWCFLLVQSLYITIPASWQVPQARPGEHDRFEFAWQCAQSALEKLGAGNRTA